MRNELHNLLVRAQAYVSDLELRSTPNGVQLESDLGVTDLSVAPVEWPEARSRPIGIITIRTTFADGTPAPAGETLAYINRWSAYGMCRVTQDGRVEALARITMYEGDDAGNDYYAYESAQSLRRQALSVYSALAARHSHSKLASWRSFIQSSFRWETAPGPGEFGAMADIMRGQGLLSTHGSSWAVIEFPLEGGSVSRSISSCAVTALARVFSDVPHPVLGVGYGMTLALSPRPLRRNASAWAARLNDAELELIDYVPRLGAWGVSGIPGQLVYSSFFPTSRPEPRRVHRAIPWLKLRADWVREAYWDQICADLEPESDAENVA